MHDVEVPRFVVGLGRGGELGLEGLELFGQGRADLPGRELAPQDDGEEPLKGGDALGGQVRPPMLRDQLGQHLLAVPGPGLALVVDVRELGRLPRLACGEGGIEHVEGQDWGSSDSHR